MKTIYKIGDTWYSHEKLFPLQKLSGQIEDHVEPFIDPALPANKVLEIIRSRHPGTLIELRDWPIDH